MKYRIGLLVVLLITALSACSPDAPGTGADGAIEQTSGGESTTQTGEQGSGSETSTDATEPTSPDESEPADDGGPGADESIQADEATQADEAGGNESTPENTTDGQQCASTAGQKCSQDADCNDGCSCTTDTCDGGTCSNKISSGCMIGNKCYKQGDKNPLNACEACDNNNPKKWSPLDGNQYQCDDGKKCTSGDVCVSGKCVGQSTCDDGKACTDDLCDAAGGGTCKNPLKSGHCLIDDTCYAANDKNKSGCGNCLPAKSATSWSPLNEGSACKNGTCFTGKCSAGVCKAGTPTKCFIGGTCYNGGAVDPKNSCQSCDPKQSSTAWSKNSGKSCDDKELCTHSDKCVAGVCKGTKYTCDDKLSCTADTCTGKRVGGKGQCSAKVKAGCAIAGACYAAGASNSKNPCQVCDPKKSTTAWSGNTGKACNDGKSCTHSDKCVAGTCRGTTYSCDDKLSCTTDTCTGKPGKAGCTHKLVANRCLISGKCYNRGQTVGNVCNVCDSTKSTSKVTYTTAKCNDNISWTHRDTCSLGKCKGIAPILGVELVSTRRDSKWLNFVVKSKIYKEDPNTMFLTMRGGGMSVWNVSNPANPVRIGGWDTKEDVEGQDRLGNLLVIVARAGKLITFDVSNPRSPKKLADLKLKTNPSAAEAALAAAIALKSGKFDALHTKLHKIGSKTYAFVTATASGEFIAIDVTNPRAPKQVGKIDANVQFIEGIYIHNGHAFVGGFGSTDVLRAINITDPTKMRVVRTLSNPDYRQMVTEMDNTHYPNVLFAALWDTNGGLGTFDVRNPTQFRLLHKITKPEMEKSNRVKLSGLEAFIPLEQDPGGLAIFDVRNPSKLVLKGIARGIKDVRLPYTLQPKGDYVYIFGTKEKSMAVLRLIRGQEKLIYGRWRVTSSVNAGTIARGWKADSGTGSMRFIDSGTGSSNTYRKTSFGSSGSIRYMQLSGGSWGKSNGLFLQHGFGNHTYYGKTMKYTLVWDLYFPTWKRNGCYSGALGLCSDIPLFQLDRYNNNDADLFVKVGKTFLSSNGFIGKTGDPINGGGLGGYTEAIDPNKWYRIAVVVNLQGNSQQVKVYVNGSLKRTANKVTYDLFSAIAEGNTRASGLKGGHNGFLLFADNNGEFNVPVRMSSFMYVNRAYSDSQIRSLGGVSSSGIPVPKP